MRSFQEKYWEQVTNKKGEVMLDKKAIKETLKTFLRSVYFTLLGLVGTFITSLATNADLQNRVVHVADDIYLPVGVVITAGLAGLAKLIDRYVHKNDNISLNGITPTDFIRNVE